jgi:hypothetical protein
MINATLSCPSMLRERSSCAISVPGNPSFASQNPLSPIIPAHPGHSSVTPIIPALTQNRGWGVPTRPQPSSNTLHLSTHPVNVGAPTFRPTPPGTPAQSAWLALPIAIFLNSEPLTTNYRLQTRPASNPCIYHYFIYQCRRADILLRYTFSFHPRTVGRPFPAEALERQ